MTRTRTQTALTKLAELVANVHGELLFVEELLTRSAESPGGPVSGPARTGSLGVGVLAFLQARHAKLTVDRDALYATVRQFDPELVPEDIGSATDWKLRFGRRGLGERTLVARYFSTCASTVNGQTGLYCVNECVERT